MRMPAASCQPPRTGSAGYDLVTGVGTVNAPAFGYELAGFPGH